MLPVKASFVKDSNAKASFKDSKGDIGSYYSIGKVFLWAPNNMRLQYSNGFIRVLKRLFRDYLEAHCT